MNTSVGNGAATTSGSGVNGRVAIVDGCRTPFQKIGTQFAGLTHLELAEQAVRGVVERNELAAGEATSVVLGSVYVPLAVPYLGRQTAMALGWDGVDGHSAECACATGARTTVDAAYQLLTGEHQVAITGGAESLSQRPLELGDSAREALVGARGDVGALLDVTLRDLLPAPPSVTEPYSGRTLLDHAEEMMVEWGVSRQDADAFATRSHKRAAAAWADGRIEQEIVPVTLADGEVVREDNLVRPDSSPELLARLRAVRPDGLLTAGSASPLTDGASAVLLMSERALERSGRTPLAFLRAWSFTGQDPALGALIGPVFALNEALGRAGLTVAQLDLLDLHEAFSGQVLSNLRAMASEEFAQRHLPGERRLGEVPDAILNVNGGSVALGHPFGATGGRLITQSANELRRRGGRYAAIGICAGGSRGAALVLEAA
ncbi:acetyl-CoA C-acyltransferase [Conexibacter sp. CPCC 206217]|uniref:acetyl-CoA C-acyltransferase n=1 Tax=Conexibacter sp. CPCC 206217 TaxID=3064574 RepID=UPI00271A1F10|nr:acetyl-CoA C-acyltransferase [Conexibacter sp. CPCC 206217]MDO8208884.1 acetyl-CoA C-acyltransferase [Conexibacter sp. CPCC 206217]